jgi:hypothetical protein
VQGKMPRRGSPQRAIDPSQVRKTGSTAAWCPFVAPVPAGFVCGGVHGHTRDSSAYAACRHSALPPASDASLHLLLPLPKLLECPPDLRAFAKLSRSKAVSRAWDSAPEHRR